MFDVDTYLKRLGYPGPREATLEVLRDLHKRHLMNVPFDNALNFDRGLDIWEHVDIDVDDTFQAIIVGGRGGVCHEISGLFRTLLRRLGFDVVIMSAGVRGPNDAFGPPLEHMFHVARFGDERWIVDVGFAGPSFLEPIRLAPGVQSQYGCEYELVEDGDAWILRRRPRDGAWQSVYRFVDRERELSEWRGDPSLREYAQELSRAETLIRGRAFETGQLTLIGRRFTTVDNGEERVRVLVKTAEYDEVVRRVLLHGR